MKCWSRILDEAEARLKFLYDGFKQKRDRLSTTESIDEIMEKTLNNNAAVSGSYKKNEEGGGTPTL